MARLFNAGCPVWVLLSLTTWVLRALPFTALVAGRRAPALHSPTSHKKEASAMLPPVCYAQPKCPVWCFPKETDAGHGGRLLFACYPAQHAVSARTLSPIRKGPAKC